VLAGVQSIFHPTDLSPSSANAFAHALALALLTRSAFTILHVGGEDEERRRLPGVREMLEGWGRLAPGSPRSAVFRDLGMRVQKVRVRSSHPLQVMLEHLEQEPADLIVLGTEGRKGVPRWLEPSVAEPLARRSRTLSLFVPREARSFVSREDGALSLRRVLVPWDREPSPDDTLDSVADLANLLERDLEVTLTHVGDGAMPSPALPPDAGLEWRESRRRGDVVAGILAEAGACDADLIAMATRGHAGFLDALRGSTTEQVLRGAECPVLAIPQA